MILRSSAVLLLVGVVAACSDRGDAATARGRRGRMEDSSGGTVALGISALRAYRTVALASTGRIEGTITTRDSVADSVVAVASNARVCGDSATLHAAHDSASALADVLVWVEGITAGKPLPEVRRATLTIEHCRFEPRVLAVSSGTTINVFSRDKAVHETAFYREGGAEPMARVHTVDEGQVVPNEQIASVAGIVEARCQAHPFARGWVAVFDHPYYAVTNASGAFTIDGLPPGTYTVKVWQERLAKPEEQRVVVSAGGAARVDLALALGR